MMSCTKWITLIGMKIITEKFNINIRKKKEEIKKEKEKNEMKDEIKDEIETKMKNETMEREEMRYRDEN